MLKKLKHLKELHAKTSQGEWKVNHGHFNGIVSNDDEGHFVLAEMNRNMPNFKNDEIFIAEAHKMVPRLIEALEKCMEQRNHYIAEKYKLNFSHEAVVCDSNNKELEQILEGTK